MKISFSTLGCPDYSWTDIYTMAKDLGYHGIEIRGLGNDILATRAKPFSEEQLPKTVWISLSRPAGHFPSERWITFVRDKVDHFPSEFPHQFVKKMQNL